jgi:transcription antitermination factor NusA-like protein
LFELEVPEIYDGTAGSSCVHELGERAKIAVTSNERDVDPVGACVGMKGRACRQSFASCVVKDRYHRVVR